MGKLTGASPKPLLNINGRPILTYILTGMRAAGIREVVIITGYLGEQIEKALGDGGSLGLSIEYRRQQQPEGTARALLLAQEALASGPFMLSWGDIIVDPTTYVAMVERFGQRPCDALLAVNRVDDPWQGAAVYVDPNWRVERMEEKPPRGTSTTPWNNAGIFVFRPVVFDYAARLQPSVRGEYELPQAIAAMIAEGRPVAAFPVPGFWSDVGTPADLEVAETALRDIKWQGQG